MGVLKALRTKDVNPHIVHQSLAVELDNLKELYVVGIAKDNSPIIWATGDLGDLCYAAKCLSVMADRYIRGEIEEE